MSVPIRDVLVVHPNAGRRAALASVALVMALAGVYGVFVTRHRLPLIAARIQAARRIIEADAAPRT